MSKEKAPKVEVKEWDIPGVGKVHACIDCEALIMGENTVRCARCTRAYFDVKDCPRCRELEAKLRKIQVKIVPKKEPVN